MKSKTNRLLNIIIIASTTIGVFIVGALINLITNALPKPINLLIVDHQILLIALLGFLICIVISLQYQKERLDKKLDNSESQIIKQEFINRLTNLYEEKYRSKMDSRLKLKLVFRHTQSGINKDYIEQHFLQTAKSDEEL